MEMLLVLKIVQVLINTMLFTVQKYYYYLTLKHNVVYVSIVYKEFRYKKWLIYVNVMILTHKYYTKMWVFWNTI